jgi:hypothetical protein
VDEIEFLAEKPFVLAVFDEELTICWNIGRLYWTKICADDAGAWMLLGEFDGPDSGSSCDVENIVKFVHRDWGCE